MIFERGLQQVFNFIAGKKLSVVSAVRPALAVK